MFLFVQVVVADTVTYSTAVETHDTDALPTTDLLEDCCPQMTHACIIEDVLTTLLFSFIVSVCESGRVSKSPPGQILVVTMY